MRYCLQNSQFYTWLFISSNLNLYVQQEIVDYVSREYKHLKGSRIFSHKTYELGTFIKLSSGHDSTFVETLKKWTSLN